VCVLQKLSPHDFEQLVQLHAARSRVAGQMRDADALQGKIEAVSSEVPSVIPFTRSECPTLNIALQAGGKDYASAFLAAAAGQTKGSPHLQFYN
jgi:hypothetical protein